MHYTTLLMKQLMKHCSHMLPAVQVDRSKENLFFPTSQSLAYLDGSLPADFGFDPLGLSDPEGAGGLINPEWLKYACVVAPMLVPRPMGRKRPTLCDVLQF